MKRLLTLVFVLFAAFAVFAQEQVAPFRDGERTMFLGDSITHGGRFLYSVDLFQALRHPGSRVTIENGGISGDVAGGGLKRLDYDILARNPDRIFIMFGMNDVGRSNYRDAAPDEAVAKKRQASLDNYRKNMRELAEKILAAGKRPVLITPSPYDQYGDCKAANLALCNDPGLAACAAIVRELAGEKELGLVDFYTPMTELLQKYPERHLAGQDRVHPGPEGHLLMTAILLRTAGETPLVASLLVDASGRYQAENAALTQVEAAAERISFSYAPKALPYPSQSAEYKALDAIYPFTETLNREMLTATGLAPGQYRLRADGKELGTFSAEQLAAGVNLALLATPSQQRAVAAAVVVEGLRGVDGKLRNIIQCNRIVTSNKGNPEDEESAYAALDRWLERDQKSSNINYYRSVVKTYKENRSKEAELKARRIELQQALWQAATPAPFTIEISR